MSALIPVHPSVLELSEEDRERLYLDDAPRWVGPTAPPLAYVQVARYRVESSAQRLADFIVDDATDDWTLGYLRDQYVRDRDALRLAEAVERHRFTPGAEGFAGWIVR